MNAWGVAGCREHLTEIVDHMMAQATERGWMSLVGQMTWQAALEATKHATITPRAFTERMVLEAIGLAEEEAAKEPAKPNESGPLVDVVYALGSGSIWNNNELRFSLRALEKYALDLGRVFVVGAKPDWLTGVEHIPMRDTCRCNKDANIISKVRAAIKAGCSKRFIFASDDQALLSPTRLADLQNYASGDLANKREWGKGKWWRRMRATRDYLVAKGLPARNFDTHVFQPHTASHFERIASEAPYAKGNGFCINTLILNSDTSVVPRGLGNSKASFYGRHGGLESIRRQCRGKIHLGYNNAGLRHGLIPWFAEAFPEKSRFETTDIAPEETRYRGRVMTEAGECLLLEEELAIFSASIPPNGRVLEIGSFHGVTAATIARKHPDAAIVSVDPYRTPGSDANWHKNQQPNMTLIKGTIDDLLAQQPEPFDVVLVDGDHHQGPCYRDLWACERLVKPDGIRLVHDYKAVPNTHVTGKRGVTKAVGLFCKRYGYKVQAVVGSVAVIAKK